VEVYAIPISVLAGALFYWYTVWLAADRDDPKDATKAFRGAVGMLSIALALLVLLVVPWALFEGWSFTQVVTADLPYRKANTTIYAIYASASAGCTCMLHALVAACASRIRPGAGG